MTIIIATGGLDETAISLFYVLCFGVFLLISGLIALSWWKQFFSAAVIALLFLLLESIFIQPWYFVISRPADGPYNEHWQFNMRIIALVWLVQIIVTIKCLRRAWRRRICP